MGRISSGDPTLGEISVGAIFWEGLSSDDTAGAQICLPSQLN